MMMTTLATLLFGVMMMTAIWSLAGDVTRDRVKQSADDRWAGVRAEAARIAALPRERQPLRVIAGDGVPMMVGHGTPQRAVVSRRTPPVLAVAA